MKSVQQCPLISKKKGMDQENLRKMRYVNRNRKDTKENIGISGALRVEEFEYDGNSGNEINAPSPLIVHSASAG